MCYGCWEDYGKPLIVNDKVARGVAAVKRLYEFTCVGGRMHVVTDDWNIDDSNLAFCDDAISDAERGVFTKYDAEPDMSPEIIAAERECLDAFWAMTEEERASALAIDSGFNELTT